MKVLEMLATGYWVPASGSAPGVVGGEVEVAAADAPGPLQHPGAGDAGDQAGHPAVPLGGGRQIVQGAARLVVEGHAAQPSAVGVAPRRVQPVTR
ncbi:hypothetical protein GCM10027055_09700 [Janibacter alkaliphilus]